MHLIHAVQDVNVTTSLVALVIYIVIKRGGGVFICFTEYQ